MNRRLLLAPLAAALLLAAVILSPASAAAGSAPCSSKNLVIWAGAEPGGGTAGSFFYRVDFTNLGGSSCTLHGTPKVSAVGLMGKQIGASARLEPGKKAKQVTLAPGDTASASLRVTNALDFPKAKCHPTYAAGLRITVPGGSGQKVAPLFFQTCASPSAEPTLGISPVSG
jgi:hypothetical protein